jgi:hypothetical protein
MANSEEKQDEFTSVRNEVFFSKWVLNSLPMHVLSGIVIVRS